MIFKAQTLQDIVKAFGYAKRLLETAKFGIIINVSKKKEKRSIPQNSYMWGVVYKQISDEWGYEIDEVHEIMKQKFLKIKEIRVDGETVIITRSTTDLKTDEMESYLEAIRRWAAINLEICILLPNECPTNYLTEND